MERDRDGEVSCQAGLEELSTAGHGLTLVLLCPEAFSLPVLESQFSFPFFFCSVALGDAWGVLQQLTYLWQSGL